MLIPIFLLFLAIGGLKAQTATLAGLTIDPSGAVVPGARVEVRREGAPVRSAISGANGSWVVDGLAPGRYLVSAAAAQLFMPEAVEVEVRAAAQNIVNLRMSVAAETQHLVVEDSAVPTVSVDPNANASATVIKGDDLQALSDDPEDLQADLMALAGPSAGPGGNEILIDGFSTGDLPPKESIREVRVNQNPFSPDYDKLGLGRVEVFTRPGTDKFHGVLPYNFGTDWWNSRNPYAAQKAPFLLQEFESSFSGPVTKKSSFTLDLEKQNIDNGAISNGVVLDAAGNAEAFSSVYSVPQRRFRIVPHLDYQLTNNNFLSLRYSYLEYSINGSGIGGFDLISRGYDQRNRFDTVQAIETSIHGAYVNETRFQYYRWGYAELPETAGPEIQVLGAFNGGGSNDPGDHQVQTSYELQNNNFVVKEDQSWRFGVRLRGSTIDSFYQNNFSGTFTYDSLDLYRAGTPSLFTISAGQPDVKVGQFEPSAYVGDDWRVRKNLTLSLGLRYEGQTNIRDHADWGPRLGVAWSPSAKTVLRGGFGIFYDRFAIANVLNAARNNGIVQQEYEVENPLFHTVPSIALLASQPQSRVAIDPGLRAPYTMQTAFTVERQLSAGTTLAATYTNAHALHVLRSEFVLRPDEGPVFLMSSSGLYNQNQLIFNLNSKVSQSVSVFGSYVLNKALSNTDGVGTFPGDPYNYAGEYGPAATDIRNRVQFGGSIAILGDIRLSPLVTWQSGTPFDITTGLDPYNTTMYFARPGLTSSGALDPDPVPGEPTIGRNAGRGPGLITANIRISKTWRLKGPFSFGAGLSIRNLLNHTNPGPIIGDINSPLFGQANSMAGSNNAQGFSENANNRRLELQLRLSF